MDPESGSVIPLSSKNSDAAVELSLENMTKKQLTDKCKQLGLVTSASNKAILIKRIKDVSVEGVRGFSTDQYLYVALSFKQTNDLKILAVNTNDYSALPSLIKAAIVKPESKWKLMMGVKHNDEFYNVIEPNGTCGFIMDYLMTTQRFSMTVEEKNSMPTHCININEPSVRQKVLDYAISLRDTPIENPRAFDNHNYILDWKSKVNGFIDFLRHYRDSTDHLSDTELWFGTQSVDLFRHNANTPYSLFVHLPQVDPVYSKLISDTRFLNITQNFTYSEMLSVVNTCNFSVLAGHHFYPYRAFHNLDKVLNEALDDLCEKLSHFMESSPLIFSTTSASKLKDARKQKKSKITYIDVDREDDSSSGEVDTSPPIGSSCAVNTWKDARDQKRIVSTCVDIGNEDEFSCGETDSDYEFAASGAPTVDCLYTANSGDSDYCNPVDSDNNIDPSDVNDVYINDCEEDLKNMTVSTKREDKKWSGFTRQMKGSRTKRRPKKESGSVEEPLRKTRKPIEEEKQVIPRELRSLLQVLVA